MKSGQRTTEFWLTMLVNVALLAAALLGKIEAEWAVVAAAIANGIYTAGRNYLKGRQGDEALNQRVNDLLARGGLRDGPPAGDADRS